MCNAWNHKLGCTCGWGGEGHSGRSTVGNRNPSWISNVPPLQSTYLSYINPNAQCPSCGASVFFYQSPSGGRVYFDELGPPWPKHPCTDNEQVPVPQLAANPVSVKNYQWMLEEWSPLILRSLLAIGDQIIEIRVSKDRPSTTHKLAKIIVCYASKSDVPCFSPSSRDFGMALDAQLGAIRETNKGEYQISLLDPHGTILSFTAYRSFKKLYALLRTKSGQKENSTLLKAPKKKKRRQRKGTQEIKITFRKK